MNIIMATSRGRGLQSQLKELGTHAVVYYYPGAKYDFLAKRAKDIILRSPSETRNNMHVYFLAGYPSMTLRKKTTNPTYDEVIFPDTPRRCNSRLMVQIHEAASVISKTGATPCFCTIIPGKLQKWNSQRLHRGKTSKLDYQEQYATMQEQLNKSSVLINQTIVTINKIYNMQTPRTHQSIVTIRKAGVYRFRYERLASDGVHFEQNSNALNIMLSELNKAICKNRGLTPPKLRQHNDEPCSPQTPKRCWKTY